MIKKYSQENMAYELNISITAYGNIERKKSDISYSRLRQIADVLEVPVYILVGYNGRVLWDLNKLVNTCCDQTRVEKNVFAVNESLFQKLTIAELNIDALERELSLKNELIKLLKISRC